MSKCDNVSIRIYSSNYTPSISDIAINLNSFGVLILWSYAIYHQWLQFTTVPLKWTNRSLNWLKYSLLQEISRVRRFEFVLLQLSIILHDEQSKYVFAQLIEFLDNNKFRHLVDKYDGNRYVNHFSTSQISSAIIAYCLVAIMQHDFQLKRSTYEVLQILSISLMDNTPLVDLFKRPDFNNVKELDCPLFPGLYD